MDWTDMSFTNEQVLQPVSKNCHLRFASFTHNSHPPYRKFFGRKSLPLQTDLDLQLFKEHN